MPDVISEKKIFTLSEVLRSVQKTLAARYTTAFWVKAEMNKLNFYKHSGHCYPELVEKSDGKIMAEIRALLWNSDYVRINQKFQRLLKEPLRDGIKILFSARLQFDPKYGLSLHILDIDPSFTLGDLEREKQETIERLKTENLYFKNKETLLPILPHRIAVISVETSKGYADFLNVMRGNKKGYRFFHMLFPSLLQGDRAAISIMNQLKRIRKVLDYFDVVTIIRGGGGEVGLTCYNDYDLAKMICEFPIPVITGIGHATNETVAEMVAYANAITPTKLAEMLLQRIDDFARPVAEAESRITELAQSILKENRTSFHATLRLFRSIQDKALMTHRNALHQSSRSIAQHASYFFVKSSEQVKMVSRDVSIHSGYLVRNEKRQLENLEKNISMLHPENILKRGFSITRFKGKSVTGTALLKEGDQVETELANGIISSTIHSIQTKNENHE